MLRLAAAGNSVVTLKVAKKAKARFKRLRKAKVSLVVVAINADGKSQKLTRSLRLSK